MSLSRNKKTKKTKKKQKNKKKNLKVISQFIHIENADV